MGTSKMGKGTESVAKPKARTGRTPMSKADRIRRLLSKGKSVLEVTNYLNKHDVPVHYAQVYRYAV